MHPDVTDLDAFQAVWIDTTDGVSQHLAEAVRCSRCETLIHTAPIGEDGLTLADLARMCIYHQCAPQREDIRMVTIAQASDLAEMDVNDVRRWCVSGQVQAVKTRGRWLIAEQSLLARVAVLDDLIDVLVGAGGNLWTKEGTSRVYFNDFWGWAGLAFPEPKAEREGTVLLDGKQIKVASSMGLLRTQVTKAFVDLGENALVLQHYGDIKTAPYTDGKGKARNLQLLGRLCSGFTRATGVELGTPVALREYRRAGTTIPIVASAGQGLPSEGAVDNGTEGPS